MSLKYEIWLVSYGHLCHIACYVATQWEGYWDLSIMAEQPRIVGFLTYIKWYLKGKLLLTPMGVLTPHVNKQ